MDGEAAVLASKRSKEKEKEREKEKEKEREKEKEKERLKDNPLYSHLKGKESKKFRSEMPSDMSFASLSADNDNDMDAAAAMKSIEDIEFAVDSVVVGDGKSIITCDCTVLYCTVLYCTVLYCNVLSCIVLYSTVLYCTVL